MKKNVFRCFNSRSANIQGFTQVELLRVILICGILPTTITSILAFNYTFRSVLKPTTKSSFVPGYVAQQVGHVLDPWN